MCAKILFVHDGRYWIDDDNQGDVKLSNVTPSWVNDEDCCIDTEISADVPLADCGQEILDMWMEVIYDEQDIDGYPHKSTFSIEC